MDLDTKIKELNIKLPKAPDPVGAYVAFKFVNNFLFISGQLPINEKNILSFNHSTLSIFTRHLC